MREHNLSVRDIVEFIHSKGDLTSEYFYNRDLLEGTKAHQYWQAKYTELDQKEVSLSYSYELENIKYVIQGRADGLLDGGIIEEIKSTKYSIEDFDENTRPEHLAQAKVYAYFYIAKNGLKSIKVRLTYISTRDYSFKSIDKRYNKTQLEKFFNRTITMYHEWNKLVQVGEEAFLNSIETIEFPFDTYRTGQRDLMAHVYSTVKKSNILYAMSPTGVGKTMAMLFSTLKAVNDVDEKVFYLTAKNAGKKIVLDSLDKLIENGFKGRAIEITNKEASCFIDEVDCDPDICPYAKDFFGKLQEAIKDIFSELLLTKNVIDEYAIKHEICPFEYALNLSNLCQVIVCDYNYAFDPKSHLIRYFDDWKYKPILLIDEAHNLVPRSKDMYSGSLCLKDLEKLASIPKVIKPSIGNSLKVLKDEFALLAEGYKSDIPDSFHDAAIKLHTKLSKVFQDNQDFDNKKDVLESFFSLNDFVRILEYYGSQYRFGYDGEYATLNCLDASTFLLNTIDNHAFGTVFFSATLYPLEYHKQLLTEGEGEHIILNSPFPRENLKVLVSGVSTRYKDRADTADEIADLVNSFSNREGKYICFFPSYQYLEMIASKINSSISTIIQTRDMTYKERYEYVERFKEKESVLGLFVMGGIFSEGIDYVGEMLDGVIIIGVGLPKYGEYNNLIKDYFNTTVGGGYDFAYTYPGINKVIQAVGRLIRSETDRGVALLVDDRFRSMKYKKLMPVHWSNRKEIDVMQLDEELGDFYGNNR